MMVARNFTPVVFWICFFSLSAGAQISMPGLPPSFAEEKLQQQVPVYELRQVNTRELELEDLLLDQRKDVPWRFGDNIEVNLNLHNAGVWEELQGGRLWRLAISSPGAYSLNLTFDKYRLPEGASLYLYNETGSFVLGAFTHLNNQQDGFFASSLVAGDMIILEYFEPYGLAFPGELSLMRVTHAYRDPLAFAKAFGDSGGCNINVACQEALPWQNMINASVMLLTGSNAFCSATLINNTREDATPYLLSASHCYRDAATVVAWFNWQSQDCSNPSVSPPFDAMSGARHLARSSVTDFWLLELNQPVPPAYRPFFAGWDRTLESVVEGNVFGVHHPRGDIKKFSYSTTGIQASAYLKEPGSGITHWRIVWSGGTTTEAGSSGSNLFDSSSRILGQLHGGYASCTENEPDWYGRLGVSWTGGGTAETRLSDWLDPLGFDPPAWNGFNPYKDPVENPSGFQAQIQGGDGINLSWMLNESQHPVMIAINQEDQFGQPYGSYALGDLIQGGGRVVYLGEGAQLLQQGLESGKTYYYRIWSFSDTKQYSSGMSAWASIPCRVYDLPFSESFNGGLIPLCWTQQPIQGESLWRVQEQAGNPFLAFDEPQATGNITRILMPQIKFLETQRGELRFMLLQPTNEGSADALTVLARKDGKWEVLQIFTDPLENWTEVVLSLEEVSEDYQIAFQANDHGGGGIMIDNVSLQGFYNVTFPAPSGLVAGVSADGVVELSWLAPEVHENKPVLWGYAIYRDSIRVSQVQNTLAYRDAGLPVGVYRYQVRAVYQDPEGESAGSNDAMAEILPANQTWKLTVSFLGEGLVNPGPGTYTYNNNTTIKLQAVASDQWTFSHWLENDVQVWEDPVLELLMDRDRKIQAVFTVNRYTVSLSSLPEDIGQLLGQGEYGYGEVVNISVNWPNHWAFRYWKEQDQILSTSASFSLAVTGHRQLVAHFEPVYYLVELLVDPPQGGSVSGGGYYHIDEQVTVEAYPAEGWYFDYWDYFGRKVSSSPSYTFNLSSPRQLTARFSQGWQVNARLVPENSGTLSGTGTFSQGASVVLEVNPFYGWSFQQWEEEGQLLSVENPLAFLATASRDLVARMEPIMRTLDIQIQGQGTTIPQAGSYQYQLGKEVELEANPDEGWIFERWEINQNPFQTETLKFTLQEDTQAIAYFKDATSDGLKPFADNVLIYPVPARGMLNVKIINQSGRAELSLMDMKGSTFGYLREDHLAAESLFTFSLEGMRAGFYILRLTIGEKTLNRKVIIH